MIPKKDKQKERVVGNLQPGTMAEPTIQILLQQKGACNNHLLSSAPSTISL